MLSSEQILKIRALFLLIVAIILYPILLILSIVSVVLNHFRKSRKCIAGEVAMITGCANGLGREIALKLAAKGCHIAVVDINEEAAIDTAKYLSDTYNIKAKAFKVDITQYEAVEELSKNIEEHLGPVTILVNNAGIMTFSSSANPRPSEVDNMIRTNLTAHFWTVRVFMNKMRDLGKGHIVAISSYAGIMPLHRQLEYTATKYGVHGFMMALRTELYALNCDFIKTTTVFPWFLKTNVKVSNLAEDAGINTYYPSISGEEAAEAIAEGIVADELEVFIPKAIVLIYRLLDLFPKAWYTTIINKAVRPEFYEKLQY